MFNIIEEEVTVVNPRLRYRLVIVPDSDPQNPRDQDNVTEMWCWHRRYTLGDEGKPRDPLTLNELRELIRERGDEVLAVMPLYLYDHSGITISTSPFSCRYDSGQIGWAFVRGSVAKKEQKAGDNRWALRMIEGEVKSYDQFLTGGYCGFQVFRELLDAVGNVEKGDQVDSCWNFEDRESALTEGRDATESQIDLAWRKRFATLKKLIRGKAPLLVREEKLGLTYA